MVLTDVSEVVSCAYNKVTEKGLLNPNLNPTLNPTLTPVALRSVASQYRWLRVGRIQSGQHTKQTPCAPEACRREAEI
jgi:hypothetical protein